MNIQALITKVQSLMAGVRANAAATATDEQGITVARAIVAGDFGCKEGAVRNLSAALLGRPLPHVEQATDYPDTLTVIVPTDASSGYALNEPVLYIRPVDGKGRGRAFDPLNPSIRNPIPVNQSRLANAQETETLLQRLSNGADAAAQWFEAGEWSLKSFRRLVS